VARQQDRNEQAGLHQVLQKTGGAPDRVCGAAGCGKGFSVVKNWRHSQRDKDNKDLWFCYPCSDKEVGIPQFPPLNLDVPSRTVSLNASTFHFLFFRSRCNSRRKRGGRA
jgi:hypothetical protein|tara:strand:+ start:402 stop:731 length:330 start_codon:yes stop_codon:yes gene_type:complete